MRDTLEDTGDILEDSGDILEVSTAITSSCRCECSCIVIELTYYLLINTFRNY